MSETNSNVHALVITGFGLNCERETTVGFRQAGATVEQTHFNDILEGKRSLEEFHILTFIGGFSFGDHLGAATVFANRIRCKLREGLKQFTEEGKLILGICNGFQTIARLGLIPGLEKELSFTPRVALAENTQGVFRDDWITVRVNPETPCVFTKGIETMDLPIRHGEGRFVPEDEELLRKIEEQNLVSLSYAAPHTGTPTEQFPANPNGSVHGIAGICNPSGRILGLMPHPEAFLCEANHPQWPRHKALDESPSSPAGQRLFDNAVSFAAKNLL